MKTLEETITNNIKESNNKIRKIGVRLTDEEALKKIIDVHGNTYDLSRFVYTGYDEKVEIGCNLHGWIFIRYGHFIKSGCPKCGDLRGSRKQRINLDKLKKKLKRIHKNKYDYSLITDENYINKGSKVPIICPIHGTFYQELGSHGKGMGCPFCCGLHKTTGDFIKEAIKIFGDLYDYSKTIYINSTTKLTIRCKKCGKFFDKLPYAHVGGQGCPHCKSSTGESLISKILKEHSIAFEKQKKFDECKRIKRLRFDFYIPSKNILIEYDGKQHFEPVRWWGGIKSFEITQIKDDIKNKYCEDNNIVLIRLPYWLSNEEIEEILINDINNN